MCSTQWQCHCLYRSWKEDPFCYETYDNSKTTMTTMTTTKELLVDIIILSTSLFTLKWSSSCLRPVIRITACFLPCLLRLFCNNCYANRSRNHKDGWNECFVSECSVSKCFYDSIDFSKEKELPLQPIFHWWPHEQKASCFPALRPNWIRDEHVDNLQEIRIGLVAVVFRMLSNHSWSILLYQA